VIVELNPQDKKLLETLSTASLQGVHLEAVPQLASGSVRVIANDMVVEDLIENRLEALARSLALKEIAPRPEPKVDVPHEALPEVIEELSFEPTLEVDEQIKKDDGEAEDVHS
jgi:hypothetical protein